MLRTVLSASIAAAATGGSYRAALLTPIALYSLGASSKGASSSALALAASSNMASPAGSPTDCPTNDIYDSEYPGTSVLRMNAVRDRVMQLSQTEKLNGRWEDVRKELLWAGGLRDLPHAIPGEGYTGHSFNDYNHVDLTTMSDDVLDNTNDGQVKGIAIGNRLGRGIRKASLPELGAGGSWSTCAIGCNIDPPQDVAHLQFRSRIAFKLVWVPNEAFDTFVLVDDDGHLLARGKPLDGPRNLPPLRERMMNYKIMAGSKYAKAADDIATGASPE